MEAPFLILLNVTWAALVTQQREHVNIFGVCYMSECDYNHYIAICISLALCCLFNWVIKQLVNTVSF